MIVHNICHVIASTLLIHYIKFPVGESLKRVLDGFQRWWGFPQCTGAIDGSHIPVAAPELNHTDYYNCKVWYSIIIQAIVDHQYLFQDICVGWPESVYDAWVLANSFIYKRIREDELLEYGDTCTILGKQIPICINGDSAYPIHNWLMKPFNYNPNLTPQQRCFKYRLSHARIVVENTFGQLKARWRHILKRKMMWQLIIYLSLLLAVFFTTFVKFTGNHLMITCSVTNPKP